MDATRSRLRTVLQDNSNDQNMATVNSERRMDVEERSMGTGQMVTELLEPFSIKKRPLQTATNTFAHGEPTRWRSSVSQLMKSTAMADVDHSDKWNRLMAEKYNKWSDLSNAITVMEKVSTSKFKLLIRKREPYSRKHQVWIGQQKLQAPTTLFQLLGSDVRCAEVLTVRLTYKWVCVDWTIILSLSTISTPTRLILNLL